MHEYYKATSEHTPKKKKKRQPKYKPVDLSHLPDEYKEEHEEIAGILEYEFGLPKDVVDRLALKIVEANKKIDQGERE